jgi:predicted nucleic acid-binding protein
MVTTSKDVTDAQLVHLARRYRLKLATFDAALCDKPWAKGVAEDPTA